MTQPRYFAIQEDELAEVERILKLYSPAVGTALSSLVRSRPAPSEQEIRKDEREKVLDYLDEWVNSGENLTLFKWELREVLRELRSKQGEP